MNQLILIRSALNWPYKKSFFLVFLCSLIGCAHEPLRLVPPQTPPPKKSFAVIRDYNTTWNALLRAVDEMGGPPVKSYRRESGTVVLEPVSVRIEQYCDCGKLGDIPLTGGAQRKGVVNLKTGAPQETLVEISCDYSTTHTWKDIYGKVARTETIPCISNGRFEQEFYQSLIRYLSP